MGLKEVFYPESKFGGISQVDGSVAFYTRIQNLLEPRYIVLDYGCGRGAYGEDPLPFRRQLRIFKGKVRQVVGLDVDQAGAENPFLDQFYCLSGDAWPLEDGSVDLCVSDHVLEHLEKPQAFFKEASRVIRPGGYLCLRTPNLLSYVALASRLVPNQAHGGVLSKVKERSNERDVFPTLYRCNTIGRIRACLDQAGFATHAVFGFGPEPAYLSFSKLAYGLGVLYQRYAPRAFQPVIFAFARRDGGEAPGGEV